MTSEESYQKYLTLSESNGTTNKISTDRGRYAIKHNLSQNKMIEWFIENNHSDENRYIQQIKVKTLLEQLQNKEDRTDFSLPKNYFDFIDLKVFASNSKCKNREMTSREVKGANVNLLYNDFYNRPSFKYSDTFYTIGNDTVQIYRDDFTIEKPELSYYRYPKQITLVNPDNPESKFTEGQLDFDDKFNNRVILMAVSLHELSADDPKYQAFKQETISKF